MTTHIGDHPTPEMYGEGFEIDCQCARCGSSCSFYRCECDDGTTWADDESDAEVCDTCLGRGGWHNCMSDSEWCKGNPLPGRENIARGEIEWFTIPKRAC